MTPMSPSHESHVPVKIAGPETETGNRYMGRKTRQRLRRKPETGGKPVLACSRCTGGLAQTVGGCLGYGIGYSIPRGEISLGIYIYICVYVCVSKSNMIYAMCVFSIP